MINANYTHGIGCEYSGIVRDAFTARGCNAISCDLLPTESPGPHWQGDVVEFVKRGWLFLGLHLPCTAIAVSGNRWYGRGMPRHDERLRAIDWTLSVWETVKRYSDSAYLENPVNVLPVKPDQYIQPWQFGHGETKKTGLWLHNLDPLQPTDVVDGRENRIWKMAPSADRAKERSKTYPGIAAAMAAQWVNH